MDLGADRDAQGALSQALANAAIEEGNKLFASGAYEDALLQYELALQIASQVPSSEIRFVCHESRAGCFWKLERFADTIEECTEALELNPSCKRTLIVRAEAHEKLQHFEEAIADMKEIAELDPTYDPAGEKMRHLEHLAAETERQMMLRSERLMAERRAMTKEEFIDMPVSSLNFPACKVTLLLLNLLRFAAEMVRMAKSSLLEHFKTPIKVVRDPITGSAICSMLP